MVQPNAIDEYASGQRCSVAHDRFGKLQSPASFVQSATGIRGKNREKSSRHDRTGPAGIAANLYRDILCFAFFVFQLRAILAIGQHEQAGVDDSIRHSLVAGDVCCRNRRRLLYQFLEIKSSEGISVEPSSS